MSGEVVEVKSGAEFPTPRPVAVASALIPYSRDDDRARLLGYICCGLTTVEALKMIGRDKVWLDSIRIADPKFLELEGRVPEFRKELAKEYVEIDFFRNFRLLLEKDYRIVKASLNPEKITVTLANGSDAEVDAPMTRQDFEYLLKMRSQYTPQQMQILESVVHSNGDGFNFARWVSENQEVVKMSRTDTITLHRSTIDAEDEDE